MIVRFRPLPTWPHPSTTPWARRGRLTFKAGWKDTLDRLEYEIDRLNGSSVIIGCLLSENDIRMDGWPRADAHQPSHPGVEVSFDTRKHGRLVYATDVCMDWQHNVRSIALGLEALRKVDLYGISSRGQQYAGWKALPTAGSGVSTLDEAWAILRTVAGVDPADDGFTFDELYRRAVMVAHPDKGGAVEMFRQVQAARSIIKANA